MKPLSDMEMDAFREFVNVGTANAATALSKLIDRRIEVSVPAPKIVPLGEVPGLLGGPELPVAGIYFKISGGMAGSIVLFLPIESAKTIVDLLTAGLKAENEEDFALIKRSALMELGNILTNSFLNALSTMVGENLFLSVPFYSEDYLGAVIDALLIEIAQVTEYAFLMDTIITVENSALAGNFIIFPDAASLEKIFGKLGL